MEEKRLLPVVDIPDITNTGSTYDTEYKPSLKWDIEAGDFVRTASNAVPRSTGYEGFQIWCRKAVATERFSCLAYSRDIGAEMEEILTESDREAAELMIRRTIEETILVNPRASSVEDFVFTWGTGHVHVSFVVNAKEGSPFTVNATIAR